MTRRGVTVPAALLTAGLATTTADAAVPIALARGLVEAAVAAVMQGTPSTGAISAVASQLTQGVLRAMFFTKLKMAAAAIVTMRRPGDRCGSCNPELIGTRAGSDRGRKGPNAQQPNPRKT